MGENSDFSAQTPLLDALDGREGPASRISAAERAALIDSVLERALPTPARVSPARRAFFLVAAALLVTGVAGAFVFAPRWFGGVPPASSSPADASSGGARRIDSGFRLRNSESRELAPSPGAAPETTSPAVLPPGPPTPSASERSPSARAAGPADLLKEANQLRGQGRWAEAERIYAQVANGYGSSAQGPVAALAAGSLRLEHLSDPRGALRFYQRAARAPSLAAEAQLGIANTYRALGDRTGEAEALRRVTRDHPQALFYQRALRRLQELEGAKP
jgi:hypothetical protein